MRSLSCVLYGPVTMIIERAGPLAMMINFSLEIGYTPLHINMLFVTAECYRERACSRWVNGEAEIWLQLLNHTKNSRATSSSIAAEMVSSSKSWIPPSLLVSSSKKKMRKRGNHCCSFRLRRKYLILPVAAFIFTTMLLGTRVRVTLDLPPYTEKYFTSPSISGFLVNAANISVGSFNLQDTIKEYRSYLITTEETEEISDSRANDYSASPPSNEEESNMEETFTNTKGNSIEDLSPSKHPRKEEKDSDSLKNLEETEVLNDYHVPLTNDTNPFIAEMNNSIEDVTLSNIKDDEWKMNSDSTKNLEETVVSNQFDDSPINASTSFVAEMVDSTSEEGTSSYNIKDNQTYMEENNSSSARNLEETKVLDHVNGASTDISTSSAAEGNNNIDRDVTFSSNIKDDKSKNDSDTTKDSEEAKVSNDLYASEINAFVAETGDRITKEEGVSSYNIKDKQTHMEGGNSSSTKNLGNPNVLDHVDDASTTISTSFVADMDDTTKKPGTSSQNTEDDKREKDSDTTTDSEEEAKVSNNLYASEINAFVAEAGDKISKEEGVSSYHIIDKQTYMEGGNSSSTRNLEKTKVSDHVDDASTTSSTSFVAVDDATKKSGTLSQNTEACNYGKGRWVADSRRPLYSGSKCKQWLSEMWACRLTQRTDFSYEGYRWQPQHCNLREFEPSAFFQRMRNKTIAFMGDSIGRQQFQSLMCMVTAGEQREEVEDVGKEFGLVKAIGAMRPDGVAYRFSRTNTTILFYWTSTLANLQPLNTSEHPYPHAAMHLDRPPTFLKQFIHRFNVLVLNTGHHWNRGNIRLHKWVLHVNGKPLEDGHALAGFGNARNFTVNSLVKWIDGQLVHLPELKVFFRTISPRHFRHGDSNSGGNCDNTIPLSGGSQVSEDESRDGLVATAVKGTRVQLLDITALSELRDEGHIHRFSVNAKQGCLHWCLPGIPDTWNEILLSMV